MATSLSIMQLIAGVRILMQNYLNNKFYGIPGIILSFNVVCAGLFVLIVLLKSKQTSRRKIRNFKLDWESKKIKVVKQGSE